MPGSDMEQVGNRIIEVADNPANVRQMAEPAFVAYVPQGSLASGKKVAGGLHHVSRCEAPGRQGCSGIAGRSPVYIARQVYSFKNGVRKGPMRHHEERGGETVRLRSDRGCVLRLVAQTRPD